MFAEPNAGVSRASAGGSQLAKFDRVEVTIVTQGKPRYATAATKHDGRLVPARLRMLYKTGKNFLILRAMCRSVRFAVTRVPFWCPFYRPSFCQLLS